MKFNIAFLFTLSFLLQASAQQPLQPNTFRSTTNPYYWKNRPPFPGYWQQDIHYMIKAEVDEKTGIISGIEKLVYYNNSPDDLDRVYFHLYSNAQTEGSYLHQVYNEYNIYPTFGQYASKGLGCNVEELKYNGRPVRTEVDNTILIVYLDEPVKSGSSATFDIQFKTYFEQMGIRNRMKSFTTSGGTHFDGVHWYPRISVYDRKFGWTADQHFDREFYGDFGTFDVELLFANDYIVEATGNLLNREEVLPAELRGKLDIKNFRDVPLGSKASVVIARDGSKKSWKYHAENVHDFAFTADPTYRIGEAEYDGVKCIALAQEGNASRWQNAAEYTAKIIKVYSEEIGAYAWPKIIVADARDGMEYPMITLDGGYDPSYRGLLAHEVGHMWFFGMVGNNETYRASLDEGFTQYLTALALTKIDGPYEVQTPAKTKYENKFREVRDNMDVEGYSTYLRDAIAGAELPLNTHSDYFGLGIRHGGGYRQVYYKPGTMLFNLQYVLGDSLFNQAFHHYFDQWKFCHPYFEDFRNAIIQYTKVDLNWFFDQWLETTKTLDYSVEKVKRTRNSNEYEITFKRKGQMQSPIEFQVKDKSGKAYDYYIPNTWFTKQTTATILPKWTGWEVLNKTYTAKVQLDNKLQEVSIDPSYHLADVYQPDNTLRKHPLAGYEREKPLLKFDSKIAIPADRRYYRVFMRPDLWYNAYDGLKIGLHQNGNYMNTYHVYSLSIWYNSNLLQGSTFDNKLKNDSLSPIDFNLHYKTSFSKYIPKTNFLFNFKSLDGLSGLRMGFEKEDDLNNLYYVYFKNMYRDHTPSSNYLLYPTEWATGKINNSISVGFDRRYAYRYGSGKININLRSSTLGSDYNDANISFTHCNNHAIGRFDLRTRAFAQVGRGNAIASESSLFLAGANPEELMENKYTRSQIYYSTAEYGFGTTTTHFHAGGGLNLRGYAGYLAPEETPDGIAFTYKGQSGGSVSAELEFDRLLRITPRLTRNWLKLDTYLFGDAGAITYKTTAGKQVISEIRADAGAGLAFTIKKFWMLQTVNPLIVRFDMPLMLSHTPFVSSEPFQFRYVIGINRAF